MHRFLRTAATIAALACIAAPATAQVNTGQSGASGAVTLNAGFTPDPFGVTVAAGGPIAASSVSESCVGNISARPSFTLNFQSNGAGPLIVSATSSGDTTLAVLGPGGQWSCDDDSGEGLNPAVTVDGARSGRYQIWVGTFGQESLEAVLHISEVQAGGSSFAGGAPDYNLEAMYGSAYLVSGFLPDPHEQELAAGGNYDARQLQDGCVGWVTTAPDYRVNFTPGETGLPLIFSVNADADTTLVVSDPSGAWVCDDDGGEFGFNPAVRFDTPLAGQYDVWVGTYSQGTQQPAVLHVSELTTW